MKDIINNNSINFESKREVGNLGEDIACIYLAKRHFRVIERNYLKKWGEIDIVAVKDRVLTFIEVKSVIDNTSHQGFRPEENVHKQKRLRLRRTIQTYIAHHCYDHDVSFIFHIVTVKMNLDTRLAHVELLENIIL